MKLTRIQLNILKYLSQYDREKLPSRRALAKELGLNSHGTVIAHIQNLTDLGFISESNGIFKLTKEIPVEGEVVELGFYGTVSAGMAIHTSSEPPQSMIKVLSSFVKNPYTSFTVKVSGDSMIDANIQDGDILVVDKSIKPKHGDIVIALVYETETTCKRLIKEVGGYYLKAENPLYDDIRVEEMEIQGVVKKLIREDVI